MAGLSDFLHLATKFCLLIFCTCWGSPPPKSLPDRISKDLSPWKLALGWYLHGEPGGRQPCLYVSPHFLVPCSGAVCLSHHLAEPRDATMPTAQVTCQPPKGNEANTETWKGSVIPSSKTISDLHSFWAEPNDVTKNSPFLQTAAQKGKNTCIWTQRFVIHTYYLLYMFPDNTQTDFTHMHLIFMTTGLHHWYFCINIGNVFYRNASRNWGHTLLFSHTHF